MKNILPASTLENRLPIYKVENNCIISKHGDYTVAFKVTLPELFTKTEAEYISIHESWLKAIKTLPTYSVVHKQDWFLEETYTPQTMESPTFLSKSFEKHFAERPYTQHYCYLYLTKTSKKNIRKQTIGTTLVKGSLVPQEILDKNEISKFMEAVSQFKAIVEGTGHIKLQRLKNVDIVGTEEKAGLLDKYFMLSNSDMRVLEDIQLNPEGVVIGNKHTCLHTLSNVDDLPSKMACDTKYEKLSTQNSTCNLSFSAPIGLLLPYNHIYNQYLFIDDSQAIINSLETEVKRMTSLSKMSRSNAINGAFIEQYLTDVHASGQSPIRAHANVMVWTDNPNKMPVIKNDVGAAISIMGAVPRHNTMDAPTMFWSGIPGNCADFPSEDTFISTIEQAICLFCNETNYQSSLSPFGIKMVDRFTGKPLHLDISDEPMERGIIHNRNKFVLGPSGSGKSFFTNHMVRQYYEQGTHVVLVDTGNSYKGLCDLIKQKTGGKDGIYYTYTEDNPISFNPFYTDDGQFDIEKQESIKALILTLWKKNDESLSRAEELSVEGAIEEYIKVIQKNKNVRPCFDTFYEFVRDEYGAILEKRFKKEGEDFNIKDYFDIDGFLYVLSAFYKGGKYDYLLNSEANLDLLSKRFVVFELDNIKDHPILFPVVTIIIMETFINKMRKLDGIRKIILIEEAWKAISNEGMAGYIKYLFKTVRKHFGEAIVVTQEIDDIIGNPIVKDVIINNSDTKILLDQSKYMNKFDVIEKLLGLTEKQKSQILSINKNRDTKRNYREVYIDLGGIHTAVYATEVSPQEYFIYTTEQREKKRLFDIAEKFDGDIEQSVKILVEQKQEEIEKKKNKSKE
jgi:conjugation system TraG family ATPase